MKLSVNTINKSYKIFKEIVHTNKYISFSLKSKDMVWLSGPTGSGKTTLIDLISGIDIIDSGEIVLDCFVLSSMKDKQRTFFRKCNIEKDVIGLFVLHNFSLEEFANRFFQNRRW
ncbi:ATP-binding cassette domain-containing protein [Borreliella valaisiana]|uniref:ABC transporter, ATP-binding protein n=1 Tax=Borreliella valaisiana VS116 TaxID=445987 RepID=C0R9H5_BORVA|nr:ATP-binding cassette domain-containing protein [Borreliella valaisiana]ACN53105.1 ABC transporter, ATP-binding protein [Borreliella valaisiana VS116]